MMPALSTRLSSWGCFSEMFAAASRMEANELRSRSMVSTLKPVALCVRSVYVKVDDFLYILYLVCGREYGKTVERL